MARPLRLQLKYLVQRAVLGLLAGLLPGLSWAQFHLGNAHAEHGFPDRALGPWRRACDADPLRPASALNLASAELDQGRPTLAVELLERLVSQQPTLASGWALLARACQKAQAYPRAIEAYRSLLGLESGNDTARLTAAVLLEKTGRKEEALALYGEVSDPALRPKAESRIRALSAPVRSA